MSSQRKVCTAVILPWLKLGEDLKLEKYIFLRWPRGDEAIDNSFRQSLDSICGMYRYVSGETEGPQTIMVDTGRELFGSLDEEAREHHVAAVTLLTMALIGENQYFHNGNYVNSSMTEVHFQNFSVGEDMVAFTSRRRDGSHTDMGYCFNDVTITTPPACRPRGGCSGVPSPWLDALASVLSGGTPLDRLILEAANLFGQANTDSPSVLVSTELVALANAFDRIFPRDDGGYELCSRLSCVLDAWTTMTVKASNRLASKKVAASKIYGQYKDIEDWKLVRFWMFELYRLRSDYVHGNDLKRHRWGWDAGEHLLLGAYVFPLLIKVLLVNEGRYELSDKDTGRINAIDPLLDLTLYYDRQTNKKLWTQVIRESGWDLSFK